MDEFVFYKNSSCNLELMWIMKENEFLCVVCFVDGNLILIVCLIKG